MRVRQRDWVVSPAPQEHAVRLRPLTGAEEEAIGVYLPQERMEEMSFAPPASRSFLACPAFVTSAEAPVRPERKRRVSRPADGAAAPLLAA